jgi:DNA invertase Pin-like site-specific DNA recombinase
MDKGQIVAYVRCSTAEQNSDRQHAAIGIFQPDRVFEDKASGKDTNRPALQEALTYLRTGDTLLVHSLDRLGRSLQDLLGLVKSLTGKGVKVHFINESLVFDPDKNNPMGQLMLGVMGAFAEFERNLIRERQAQGIAVAKAKGNVYKGRKPTLDKEQVEQLRADVSAGQVKATVAKKFGISRQTLYAYLA